MHVCSCKNFKGRTVNHCAIHPGMFIPAGGMTVTAFTLDGRELTFPGIHCDSVVYRDGILSFESESVRESAIYSVPNVSHWITK